MVIMYKQKIYSISVVSPVFPGTYKSSPILKKSIL